VGRCWSFYSIRFEVRVLRVVEENYGRLAIAKRRLEGGGEEGEATREGWAARKKKKKPKSGRQKKEKGGETRRSLNRPKHATRVSDGPLSLEKVNIQGDGNAMKPNRQSCISWGDGK
jgi:hypothetical protein